MVDLKALARGNFVRIEGFKDWFRVTNVSLMVSCINSKGKSITVGAGRIIDVCRRGDASYDYLKREFLYGVYSKKRSAINAALEALKDYEPTSLSGGNVPSQSSEKQPQEINDELCNLRKSVETLLAREYELVMERDALRKEVKRTLKRHEERVAYFSREVSRKDEEITLLRRADRSSEDVQYKLQGVLKAKLAAEAKLKEVNSALLKSEAHITSLSTALRRKDELLNLSQEEINTRQRMDVEKRAAYEKALNEQRDVISHLQNEVYIKRQQVLSKDHELESLKEQESCSLNKKVRDILLSLAHPCAEITIEEAATILCVPAPYAVALMNTGVIRAYPSRTGRQYVRVHDVVKLQEEYEASKAGSL
jgi:hypothetical protein